MAGNLGVSPSLTYTHIKGTPEDGLSKLQTPKQVNLGHLTTTNYFN